MTTYAEDFCQRCGTPSLVSTGIILRQTGEDVWITWCKNCKGYFEITPAPPVAIADPPAEPPTEQAAPPPTE